MIQENYGEYERLDKRVARRLYNEGKTIRIKKNKTRLDCGFDISNSNGAGFDKTIYNFMYYNSDSELGSQVQYFCKKKDMNR